MYGAIVSVLLEEGHYLRVAEVYRRVQQRVEGPVSYGQVREYLNKRSHGKKQLFERRAGAGQFE